MEQSAAGLAQAAAGVEHCAASLEHCAAGVEHSTAVAVRPAMAVARFAAYLLPVATGLARPSSVFFLYSSLPLA